MELHSTSIDKIFSQLIKRHEKLTEDINIIPKGVESLTYNFTEIITMNTFVKTPEWLTLKRCVLNPQNNDNKCFQYFVTLYLYHEQIGKNYYRVPKIKPLLTILIGKISTFYQKYKIAILLK